MHMIEKKHCRYVNDHGDAEVSIYQVFPGFWRMCTYSPWRQQSGFAVTGAAISSGEKPVSSVFSRICTQRRSISKRVFQAEDSGAVSGAQRNRCAQE